MESAIAIDALSFDYGGTPILTNVSLSVGEGEWVGIFGPNGGGKTTLLKLIIGLLTPSCGQVKVFGKTPQEARDQISYVPQKFLYDKQFPISVFEVVLSGRVAHLPWYGRYTKQDRECAFEMLEKVGMANYAHQSFGTLSGGQAQRVLIAHALVSSPKLLLLDEATAGVDAKAEAEIQNLLQKMWGSLTVVMVTHHLEAVINQVNRVFCVQNQVIPLKPQEVCEHFALGLYHSLPSDEKGS